MWTSCVAAIDSKHSNAMKLIDTDIAIDHFHGHQAALEFIASVFADGEAVAVSVVTVAELTGGLRTGEEARTERLLGMFVKLDVTDTIAHRAGAYLRAFRSSASIDLGDALIAATAAEHAAELVTRNVRHYPMTDITVTVPYERGRV